MCVCVCELNQNHSEDIEHKKVYRQFYFLISGQKETNIPVLNRQYISMTTVVFNITMLAFLNYSIFV